MKPKSEQNGREYRYVDRPEIGEIYADAIETIVVDGAALKMEFVVNRLDTPRDGKQASGRKYPVCRLFMPPKGAIELYNKLTQMMSALEQAGAVTRHTVHTPGSLPTIQ
jgi:hypothetical protein